MIQSLFRATDSVRRHASRIVLSPDGQFVARGIVRASRAVAVDAGVVALLVAVVAFAATRPTGAAPKAWYYAGGYGGGGYGGGGYGGGGYGGGYGYDLDTDGDGIRDTKDTDDDNDGVPDVEDGCPRSALKVTPGACGCDAPDEDFDGDGVADCASALWGTVRAWGANWDGQRHVPADLGLVTAVAAGGSHTVALRADGTVRAWGSNYIGQSHVPSDLGVVTAIAAGAYHTVALRADGTVRAWGFIWDGVLDVPSDLGVVTAIAAGWRHTVALRADGTVRAWGANWYGQTSVPPNLGGVTAVAAGGNHTLALRANGTVRAWGYNGFGEAPSPVGLRWALAIAAGDYHSAAVCATDCNASGQPDWMELPLHDIDRDGILDICEVVAGAADCNADGVPDADQVAALRERELWAGFAPDGQSRDFAMASVRDASPGSTVEITAEAWGDLAGSGEYLRLEIAGALLELAGSKEAFASATVTAAAFNEAIELNRFGSLRVRATSGPMVDEVAGSNNFRVSIRYLSGTVTDCNLNGVPDSCDLASGVQTDCNANGIPDNCDVGAEPVFSGGGAGVCKGGEFVGTFEVARRAVLGTTVSVNITARGDTDRGAALGEFIQFSIGASSIMHQGIPCEQPGHYALQIDAAAFNALIGSDGRVPFSVVAGSDTECLYCNNRVDFVVVYTGVDPANDCNVNGLPDGCDLSSGTSADVDSDGKPDECVPPDRDRDGIPDSDDPDDDNDGVPDELDAFPYDASESADTDGDGAGNNADIDDDNDGLLDLGDNCPLVANLEQLDLDLDGQGDACDADDDNDGVVDGVDNCPATPNASQSDCDENSIGDACDTGSTMPGPNIVVDGGFEASGYDGVFQGECYTSGGFSMAGWQHGAARTEDLFRNSSGGNCFGTPELPGGGQYLMSLQGSGCCNCNVNGAVWQTLSTEAGRTYTFRMSVYLDPSDSIRVTLGGQTRTFTAGAGGVPVEEWAEVDCEFDGLGGPAELRIASIGPNASGCLEAEYALVDNVRLSRDQLLVDCNLNGQQDLLEIAAGTASDCNSNCTPDSCEPDADADGVIDACDPCPGKPGAACGGCPANECGGCGAPEDLDGDGVPDCVDADDDGDDFPDTIDAFPDDPSEWLDTDTDGIGNNADLDDDGDGVPDAADNCALLPNPGQADCDASGVGDACQIAADPALDCDGSGTLDSCDRAGGVGDCDADGILDSCEFADGAQDCNANGVPDSCDIEDFLLEDCNANGVGDSCEKQVSLELTSGVRAPLGAGHPQQWTLQQVVPAVDMVHVELRAKGDLSSLLEYVDVALPGGILPYRAFNRVPPSPPDADCVELVDGFLVQPDAFNAAIAPDGSFAISAVASAAVDPAFCGGDTRIEIRVRYAGASVSTDCNANGVLDSCEIAAGTAADSDGNGIPDECVDPISPCPADFDGSGHVSGIDLGALLSRWGETNPYYDLSGDGRVSGIDLGMLLSAWGPCQD